jgi:hypothetical protein
MSHSPPSARISTGCYQFPSHLYLLMTGPVPMHLHWEFAVQVPEVTELQELEGILSMLHSAGQISQKMFL